MSDTGKTYLETVWRDIAGKWHYSLFDWDFPAGRATLEVGPYEREKTCRAAMRRVRNRRNAEKRKRT
jgi:hypothetical protein